MAIDRAEIKADARDQIRGKIGSLLVVGVVLWLTFIVFAIPAGLPLIIFGGALLINVVGIFLTLAKIGETPRVGDIFKSLGENISRGFFAVVRIAFFTWAWSLLFVIPGIVKELAYSQTFYLLADDPNLTAKEAQQASIDLMRGRKGELFILYLSFLGWEFVSLFTFGLLQIWLIPYIQTTLANFYLKLTASAE